MKLKLIAGSGCDSDLIYDEHDDMVATTYRCGKTSPKDFVAEIVKRVNAYDEMKSREEMMRGQIAEAIAILESGTKYEKMHLVGILKDGLPKGEPK